MLSPFRTHLPTEPIEGERRRQERIYEPFPVTIRSVDTSGEASENHTVLDDFGATGFNVRLERCVDRGANFFTIV
jgi:hypothetical protein